MRNISLHCLAGPLRDQTFRLRGGPAFIFGRCAKASFGMASDPAASHLHFLIDTSEERVRIIDLGSTNGLVINEKHMGGKQGTPFTDFVQLKSGDTVLAGACLFRLSVIEEPTSFLFGGAMPGAGMNEPGTDRTPVGRITTIIQKDISARLAARSREKTDVRENGDYNGGGFPDIPGYTVTEQLASGGKAVVFKAVKDDTGAAAAIKILTPQWSDKPRSLELFRREIDIVRQMRHVNIIHYIGDGTAEGKPYLATEYVAGGSMDELILAAPAHRLEVQQAVPLFLQLLEAVAYMHRMSLVHRDINPKNILLDLRRGGGFAVKLSDMGLSCQSSAAASGGADFPLLAAGGGSVAFMPPERLTDAGRALPESDVFSAAATFFRMVTGESPYEFTDRDRNEAVMAGRIKAIADMRPDLPGHASDVIARALSHIPENRYPDAQTFLNAFSVSLT